MRAFVRALTQKIPRQYRNHGGSFGVFLGLFHERFEMGEMLERVDVRYVTEDQSTFRILARRGFPRFNPVYFIRCTRGSTSPTH